MGYYDLILFAENGKSALQQMTTQQRQVVFSSLAIVVLLGVMMILLISLTARTMRRYVRGIAKSSPAENPLEKGDDWATKRMIELEPDDRLGERNGN